MQMCVLVFMDKDPATPRLVMTRPFPRRSSLLATPGRAVGQLPCSRPVTRLADAWRPPPPFHWARPHRQHSFVPAASPGEDTADMRKGTNFRLDVLTLSKTKKNDFFFLSFFSGAISVPAHLSGHRPALWFPCGWHEVSAFPSHRVLLSRVAAKLTCLIFSLPCMWGRLPGRGLLFFTYVCFLLEQSST